MNETTQPGPFEVRLSDQLGRAPWADDVEAWLEVSNAEEIANDIDRYALEVAARAQAAERERCKKAVYDATDWAHDERDFALKEAIVEWINGPNAKFTGFGRRKE